MRISSHWHFANRSQLPWGFPTKGLRLARALPGKKYQNLNSRRRCSDLAIRVWWLR